MSGISGTATDRTRPVVGIVMGSDSDWPVMGAAAEVLDEFGVAYEADVVSAHRMPTEMIDYGRAAAEEDCVSSSPAPGERPTCPGCWRPSPSCRSSGCRCR